ncbi:hypothetical protein ACR52_04575 [Pseudomonas fildesensis]|uniref:Uncharacterized protein n=1 Tax=Pseudomonas fildesensis TaxID=1674920 RepID=A0A0J8G2U0_9PSED|nr:hypothetical protein ACR52_04575 [Pseudomonas fildesensis]
MQVRVNQYINAFTGPYVSRMHPVQHHVLRERKIQPLMAIDVHIRVAAPRLSLLDPQPKGAGPGDVLAGACHQAIHWVGPLRTNIVGLHRQGDVFKAQVVPPINAWATGTEVLPQNN